MPGPPAQAQHPFLTGLAAALPPAGFWDSPAVVGVSGGADSVALLVGLCRLAPTGARLIVAHARHDLRHAAHEDEGFVSALASRLGIPCDARPLAVRDDPEGRGEGLEARARRLRYDFLVDVARSRSARHVIVGHTADDQAETILHRILRGTGLGGLAGMRPSRALADGVALVRPLLRLPRALGRDFLAAEGETWRDDASNDDLRHARNFLRHDILARAIRGPYPAATEAIVRAGEHVSRSAAALTSAAPHLLEAHARRQHDGRVVLDAAALAGLDRHLLAHLVAVLWEREGWPRRDMTARHHEAVVDLLVTVGRGDRPAMSAFDLPAGVRVTAAGRGRIECARTPQRTTAE